MEKNKKKKKGRFFIYNVTLLVTFVKSSYNLFLLIILVGKNCGFREAIHDFNFLYTKIKVKTFNQILNLFYKVKIQEKIRL